MSQSQTTTAKINAAHLKCAACGQEATAFVSINMVIESREWMRVRQMQISLCTDCAGRARNGIDVLALARVLGCVNERIDQAMHEGFVRWWRWLR
jgi:hypothetical protein